MRQYSPEPRTRKDVKEYGFLSFARKYKKQLLDTGLDSLKTASKKVVHKRGEFLGNKIANTDRNTDAVTTLYDDKIVKTKPVEEIIIPPEKKRSIKLIKTSIIKMEHYKKSKLLNALTVSKFVTKKWIEVNNLSSGQYSTNKNIRFKTSILRSDLCDYNDAYINAKVRISVRGTSDANTINRKPTFQEKC